MDNIIYSDKKRVKKILKNIWKDGVEKLHLLADFDRTLTKAFLNGKMRPSLISVLRSEWYLSEDYRKEAYELFDYYNPIETNPNISIDIKIKEMSDWWHKHLNLLVKTWLNINDIKKISTSWNIEFRNWTKDLLENLKKNKIPLLIISANWLWKDSIELYLESEKRLFDNIYIISNTLEWDIKWNAIWYDPRVIHSFNKWETVLEDFPEIYNKIKERKNVILLWDSLWDPHMIDWFNYDNLLKIWFLNDKIEELLPIYLEKYDIVITWDWDMFFLNNFFEKCF